MSEWEYTWYQRAWRWLRQNTYGKIRYEIDCRKRNRAIVKRFEEFKKSRGIL